MENHNQSRRVFIKSSALAGTLLAGGAVSSCQNTTTKHLAVKYEKIPQFSNQNYQFTDGYNGLLFSQIGYEQEMPVKVIIRLPKRELLTEKTSCLLTPTENEQKYQTDFKYWGKLWKSHWWIAEFSDINESGEWNLIVNDDGNEVFQSRGLKVGKNILWDSSVPYASVDMLERRKHFTKVGAGWQDAGTLWVESPAQSAMIIALTELLEQSPDRFDQQFKERIFEQLTVGADYLVMTRKKAEELGYAKGAMSHDLLGHEHDILPHDAAKAVVALLRTVQYLPDNFAEKKAAYKNTADLTYNWLITEAKPMGDLGMSKRQRGLAADAFIPGDEWMTRDLVTMAWASLEKYKAGDEAAKQQAVDFADQVMSRQIPESEAESGFYGHFYEYDSTRHSEKSWCHGIVDNKFGADIGGIYPNYLMPLIEMTRMWPDNENAEKWKSTLTNFTNGYLIPACQANPFNIVPLGIFGDEGPIWFAGPFHGTNTIYGYTAALALELEKMLNKP